MPMLRCAEDDCNNLAEFIVNERKPVCAYHANKLKEILRKHSEFIDSELRKAGLIPSVSDAPESPAATLPGYQHVVHRDP